MILRTDVENCTIKMSLQNSEQYFFFYFSEPSSPAPPLQSTTALTIPSQSAQEDIPTSMTGVEIALYAVAAALGVTIIVGIIVYCRCLKSKQTPIVEYKPDSETVNILSNGQVPPNNLPRRTASVSSTGSAAVSLLRQRSMRSRLESRLTQLSEIEIAYDPLWEIDRNDIFLQGALGEGAFGKVMKAQVFGGKLASSGPLTVAVKMLKGLLL